MVKMRMRYFAMVKLKMGYFAIVEFDGHRLIEAIGEDGIAQAFDGWRVRPEKTDVAQVILTRPGVMMGMWGVKCNGNFFVTAGSDEFDEIGFQLFGDGLQAAVVRDLEFFYPAVGGGVLFWVADDDGGFVDGRAVGVGDGFQVFGGEVGCLALFAGVAAWAEDVDGGGHGGSGLELFFWGGGFAAPWLNSGLK